ncbi:N-acetyltransferase 9 [Linnemannia gamsii]|uniref:N-acetyltransferase 9-like protein n=1 Tax=Linnemannia gamsii TaxID=64522 RepID=A0A9P6R969_9FUNG|nr:N-acetyltransferase 9 [Linnemannia gamsii]
MLDNENLVLVGQKCILVPYMKRHVDHYNKWMQSPELLEMTASEPLTIEEEYEMQESWRVDENKCTFIILARETPEQEISPENALAQPMVGDVNLFFNDHDDPHSAEIEIMIAEPSYRRKGLGLEALRMMMTYAYQSLGTKRITAKISTENKGSIQLFLTQLGFVQISYSQIFEEVTLERVLTVSGSSSTFAATKTVTGLVEDLTLQSDHEHPSSSSSSRNVGSVDETETEESDSRNSISIVLSSAKTNDGDDEEEEGDWIQEPATTALFETLELNDSDLDHSRE